MIRWIGRALRSLAIAVAIVVGLGVVVGARPFYAYQELRCASGYTAQPVSIMPVYQCRPAIPDPTAIQWPQVVTTEHRVALYLTNLRIRVFDIDYVWGTHHWLAFDVPPA